MKKIIEGKMYNTETAKELGSFTYGQYGDLNYTEETLYQTKKGQFFIYYEGGANTRYAEDLGNGSSGSGNGIKLYDRVEAQEWAERYLTAEKYEEIFGEVEEG